MSSIDDSGFDTRIADWLEADPNLAPPDLMRTVEAALPLIPQRRATSLPWRLPRMSTFAKLAVAAVAVIAIGTLGIVALQPAGTGVGSGPAASPSPSASPTAAPTASAAPATPPPLGETFVSTTNGISIAYPAGWSTKAATEAWTTRGWPSFDQARGDFLYDPGLRDHLFIAIGSQPLDGRTDDEWVSDTLRADDCTPSTSAITIDDVPGVIGDGCDMAAVTLDGRGYVIVLYTSDDEPGLSESYDRAWFEQLLATVDLRPEDAAGAPPSP